MCCSTFGQRGAHHALKRCHRWKLFTNHFVSEDWLSSQFHQTPDGASVVDGFVTKLGVTFPILLDPKAQVAGLYGAKNLPVTFLIDPNGKVIAAAQGARDWNSQEARSVIDELLPKQ